MAVGDAVLAEEEQRIENGAAAAAAEYNAIEAFEIQESRMVE